MKKKAAFVITFLLIITGFGYKAAAQNDSAALAAADSSRFSVNKQEGWQLYNSFINFYQSDSAQVEIIVEHTNDINFMAEQYVGRIKYNPLLPQDEQIIEFDLLSNRYTLRVTNTGECFLRFLSGVNPDGDPVVIPIRVCYKL